jgi:hypothetical protein
MATWKKIEEIAVWQKSRLLAQTFFETVKKSENGLERDYALKDQMNRSSGSIMDNMRKDLIEVAPKNSCSFCLIPKALPVNFSLNCTGRSNADIYRKMCLNNCTTTRRKSQKC